MGAEALATAMAAVLLDTGGLDMAEGTGDRGTAAGTIVVDIGNTDNRIDSSMFDSAAFGSPFSFGPYVRLWPEVRIDHFSRQPGFK